MGKSTINKSPFSIANCNNTTDWDDDHGHLDGRSAGKVFLAPQDQLGIHASRPAIHDATCSFQVWVILDALDGVYQPKLRLDFVFVVCKKYTWSHDHACNWLVVWNMNLIFHDFSIYWEFNHPNWRTHIFQRGRYTTKQLQFKSRRPEWILQRCDCCDAGPHFVSLCFCCSNTKSCQHWHPFDLTSNIIQPKNGSKTGLEDDFTRIYSNILCIYIY